MTGYTQPDLLPFPDNYNDPADVPKDIEALAVTTQSALLLRPTQADLLWVPYSPEIYQNVTLGTQVISARYARVGSAIVTHVDVRATTGGGTTDPWIRCSLPVPARNASGLPIGQGRYSRFGFACKFHVNIYSPTQVVFEATHLLTDSYACLGENPNLVVAAGDAIQFSATYEMQ